MCYCLMTFIIECHNLMARLYAEILQEQQRDGGFQSHEVQKQDILNLNTASWYIRQRRGYLHTSVHVQVCDLLKRLSTFTVWSTASVVCLQRHTRRSERQEY